MKIIWSPLAVDRATEISDYIGRDDPESARKWARSILEKVELLQNFPEAGRIVPELNRNDIRELLHKIYRIIYRVQTDCVAILTIRHIRQLLSSEDFE